ALSSSFDTDVRRPLRTAALPHGSRRPHFQPRYPMDNCVRRWIVVAFGLVACAFGTACRGPQTSVVDDGGGRTVEDFPELAADVFKPLDGGIALSEDEIKGRNTWNLWTGGNEQFWDRMARE